MFKFCQIAVVIYILSHLDFCCYYDIDEGDTRKGERMFKFCQIAVVIYILSHLEFC